MRLFLAATVAILTGVSLAVIRPAILTDGERGAAASIRESRMRADTRFLSSDLLEGWSPEAPGARLARAYLASRFEALALEPGASGDSWEQGSNVIARLPGRDPELAKEVVLFTAHHDGTLDNAAGLATLLAVAEAFTALPERPRRSILFAALATDAQGLLSPQRTVAHIDLDGGHRGASTFRLGAGQSTLDDWLRAIAEAQGRHVALEGFPDETAYAFSGTVEDAQLVFLLGVKVADAPRPPSWRPGDELEAAQRKALAEIGQ
jgi:hypothetical protein